MGGLAFKTLGGDGEDIVLIHGFGSDRLSWLGNSPALMPIARVHALDLPGHGDSAPDAGNGAPKELVRRVSATLDERGIGKAHLVGHSLGGGLALLMAADQPERAASLSLIAPAGLGRGVDRDFLATYPEATDAENITPLLHRLVVVPQLINKMTVKRVQDHLGREGVREALRAISSGLVRHEADFALAAERVAALNIPRLTIWGERDAINPLDSDRVAAFGGTSHIVPNAGHLPHIEAFRTVNDHLVTFLKQAMAR